MNQHENFVRMTTQPVERLICRMAVPTIVTMMITALYNTADTFFVGLLHDTSATGAVGVVFSFMAVIQACGFFFGQGSGNCISRLLGQEKTDEAARMASIGFFSALIVGTVITTLGLIFLEPLARLLGSTETILPYAVSYLQIILLGAPYMTSSLMLNNLLRYQGNAFYSMLGIGSGAALNVALDPLFIFTLRMGIAGAAAATIISQLVGFVVLLFFCTHGDNLHISLRLFRPRFADYRTILHGGLPTLCRQTLSSISTICLNRMAGLCGADAAIAAMAVATKVVGLLYSMILGFGQGFQPVCGFNYGAGQYSRVRRGWRFCVCTVTLFLLAACAVCFAFAPRLTALFSHDPAVIRIGALSLRLLCSAFPGIGFITVSNMLLQNIGKVGRSTFLAMARQGIFFIPLVIGLPLLLPRLIPGCSALLGVQIAQPAADFITFLCSIPLTVGVLRRFGPDRAL